MLGAKRATNPLDPEGGGGYDAVQGPGTQLDSSRHSAAILAQIQSAEFRAEFLFRTFKCFFVSPWNGKGSSFEGELTVFEGNPEANCGH